MTSKKLWNNLLEKYGQLFPCAPSDFDVSRLPELSGFSPDSLLLLPGFCDVHVHFREPGFSYKETIRSGSRAAARGGYTTVCTMPNLNPVPDSPAHLKEQLDSIRKDAVIQVLPYGAITVGEQGKALSDMKGLAPQVCAFSDDGKGVQDETLMRQAMREAHGLGRLIAAHCEDTSLLHGGYIHDGAYAALHGHRGICSESEYRPIQRDIRLCAETGCAYHVCHISSAESVAMIREAKAQGIPVTCETAPHYLVLDEEDLKEDGRYKMNPPLRSRRDREALIQGLLDGTIDMIATDHAPHTREEKAKGLENSAFGVVGLETAFPILYTKLVRTGILTLEMLVDKMAASPRKRFGIPADGGFSLWEIGRPLAVSSTDFLSMGRATPFEGETVYARCLATVYDNTVVYSAEKERADIL